MKKRLPLELEAEVKKAFQMKCLENDENMTKILTKFVEAYNKNPKEVKKFIER